MVKTLRIAVIGSYNFAYHSHNATNQAINAAAKVLDQPINFYWISETEFCETDKKELDEKYDGFFIAPGPYQKPFYFNAVFKILLALDKPVLGTGEVFKHLITYYFNNKGLGNEKIISDNLISSNQFTEINLDKYSPECHKLYMNKAGIEYSSSRYSILPQYTDILAEDFEIGARNQFFDPEIIKHKTHPFFMFTMFCPQINSTEDLPHPIIIYFIKTIVRISDIKETESA
jgi:CTP synthase (UTP-ammonia lyase)